MGLWLFGESGLVGWGVTLRIGRFPVQTPIDAGPGLGTQPLYEFPGDSQVEISACSEEHRVSEATPSLEAQSWS